MTKPDLSGSVKETKVTVKLSKNMDTAWKVLCDARGHHHREAVRYLIEREIRMHHNMPMPDPLPQKDGLRK